MQLAHTQCLLAQNPAPPHIHTAHFLLHPARIGVHCVHELMEDEMATIYSGDGYEITTGLQPSSACDEAVKAAYAIAEERGEDVFLEDDGAHGGDAAV